MPAFADVGPCYFDICGYRRDFFGVVLSIRRSFGDVSLSNTARSRGVVFLGDGFHGTQPCYIGGVGGGG